LEAALEQTLGQPGIDVQVIVVDNASNDGTVDILETFEDRCHIIYNQQNVGFAAAQNQAIAMSAGTWVLTLNPDVLLMPGFIAALVEAGSADPKIGTVCGKLLSFKSNFEIPDEPKIDSTGIYFSPTLRHFDRGSQEVDRGQYAQDEFVFGATAAAALYRREMIDDVAEAGANGTAEFFDPDFFVYREDADVAWRAQLLGWKCLYTPRALGYHVRTVLPGNRAALAPMINMHSVKNRFLMRIKNATPGVYRKCFAAATVRDAIVLLACLVKEQSSLAGLAFVARNWARFKEKRAAIMARKRVTDEYLAQWFALRPASVALPAVSNLASTASTVARVEKR
jgi:GT2 family glycosyltransferase